MSNQSFTRTARGTITSPELPFLPGCELRDPTHQRFARTQSLGYGSTGPALHEPIPVPSTSLYATGCAPAPAVSMMATATLAPAGAYDTTYRRSIETVGQTMFGDSGKATEPHYVRYDKVVLRFFARSEEKIAPAAGIINSTVTLATALGARNGAELNARRVHDVAILFYVEDGTVEINEVRQPNSGCAHTQGRIQRRRRVPVDGSEAPAPVPGRAPATRYLSAGDFNVGRTVVIAGTEYYLRGCDAATRDFLTQELGMDVPANEAGLHEAGDPMVRARHAEDALRAGRSHTAPRVEDDPLTRYLVHDRDVLRFYGVWVDEQGDRRRMIIHHFLADGSSEVREEVPPNAGRDRHSLFLRRTRLPRSPAVTARGLVAGSCPAAAAAESSARDYITHEDLYVGAVVDVLGRRVELIDCDARTRSYYVDTLGADPALYTPAPAPAAAPALRSAPVSIPPYIPYCTIGTDRDSRQSCLSLHPSETYRPRPLRDEFQPSACLRFNLRLDGDAVATPTDRERPFVLLYRPYDNTVSVTEKSGGPQGYIPGLYINRTPVGEVMSGTDVSFNDITEIIEPGTLLRIAGRTFCSLGPADQGTRTFLREQYGCNLEQ